MGRTQSFDTEQVVRAARAVFWENGFEEASLPALEAATGLGRSSLYHAFASKRGLFDAAVQSYLDEVVRPRLVPLVTPSGASPSALEDYFTGLRAALADAQTFSARSGCLLLNAAGAPIARDEAVREVIADYRAELLRALRAGALARWPQSPEWASGQADVLVSLVVAALVLARVDPAQSLATVDAALALVCAAAP
ncbi:TetR/AcrR family transcriptional regulator [Rathayibacter iranicus]|uniref:TetR/AcrR family transcriptional regulator n=2 Tax=Rathayibacter iranicus TaxID=59737 RepID=A0AAD1EL93_9MICO|nr:TetR/AcrR family transcriptional regulator [Rathayibacter iranicus]AZZ54808.1 TetR/AcrR family transcriptional regulator [Rathayibacter iranicus]MWV31372.1 TetR family transcriptional regulator [Rathayibacter iranicus NCPPB 2253 = VKM Ac-1602]PPI50401.1 TetR/AcrR family transcriptional regulator [Rathayibacter iranicus]PPI62727.1 TetR/AcrR family transcriptional regulator [Rathayibacter iranicus]PPI73800.1 TetR/AcrR family transcriptional regulator [Rathayibacter iranicus]